jgi:hypothetical protein
MAADPGSRAERIARRLRRIAIVLLLLIPVVAWVGRGGSQGCEPPGQASCVTVSVVPGWVGWSVFGLAMAAIVMFLVAAIVTALPDDE